MTDRDIADELAAFIPTTEPKKWAKISSTINYRRLQLYLLREILLEIRKVNETLERLEKSVPIEEEQ